MRTPRAATTAMLAVVLLVACRSHKETTASTKEQFDIEAAGSSSIATTSRSQWLSRLSLDIDSFEFVIPTDHFADIGKISASRGQHHARMSVAEAQPDLSKMDSVTAMDLPEQFALGAGQPRSRSIVLRGKHARLGKADILQRDAARLAEQVDTLSAHRSIDKADHYARDNVGIMKPPDVTWWPWLLLTGLLVGFCIVIWLQDRGK